MVKAQVDVSQADNDLIANERALITAQASLNRLLGRTGGAPIETTDSLEVPASIAELEALEKLALSSRPELKSLEIQRQGAKAATRLARQYWAPDINVTFSRNAVAGEPHDLHHRHRARLPHLLPPAPAGRGRRRRSTASRSWRPTSPTSRPRSASTCGPPTPPPRRRCGRPSSCATSCCRRRARSTGSPPSATVSAAPPPSSCSTPSGPCSTPRSSTPTPWPPPTTPRPPSSSRWELPSRAVRRTFRSPPMRDRSDRRFGGRGRRSPSPSCRLRGRLRRRARSPTNRPGDSGGTGGGEARAELTLDPAQRQKVRLEKVALTPFPPHPRDDRHRRLRPEPGHPGAGADLGPGGAPPGRGGRPRRPRPGPGHRGLARFRRPTSARCAKPRPRPRTPGGWRDSIEQLLKNDAIARRDMEQAADRRGRRRGRPRRRSAAAPRPRGRRQDA